MAGLRPLQVANIFSKVACTGTYVEQHATSQCTYRAFVGDKSLSVPTLDRIFSNQTSPYSLEKTVGLS